MKHLAILSVLALSACAPDSEIPRRAGSPAFSPNANPNDRLSACTLYGYGQAGTVSIVTDAKTGKEYLVAMNWNGGVAVVDIGGGSVATGEPK